MNIRQFIQTQKAQHTERRSKHIEQAMQENKEKLKRAEQERAYRLQKEKLRQTKKENFKLKTKPISELRGQAKSIMNTIQKRKKVTAKPSNPTRQKTIKIVIQEPEVKKEEVKSVWRV